MIITVIIFIAILGLLVFVHEAGHFFVAKKSGMKVDEFGFGFPPRLIGLQKIEGKWKIIKGHGDPENKEVTVYSLNWIPLGGFVKIVGENNDTNEDPRSFVNKPFFSRLATLLAGVSMNVLLAWVLISVSYATIGLPVAIDTQNDLPAGSTLRNQQVLIYEVVPNSPADKAGLQAGDILMKLDDSAGLTAEQAREYIRQHKGATFNFEVSRNNEQKNLVVASLSEPPPGSGPTGIVLTGFGKIRFPVHVAFWEGARATIGQMGAIISGFGKLFRSGEVLQNLGGPVKIAQITGQVARMGIDHLIQLTAFLSLNLAILNVLPIPALDGGRVLFLVIEKLRGKKMNPQIEQIVNASGFVLLLIIMLLITVKDVWSITH